MYDHLDDECEMLNNKTREEVDDDVVEGDMDEMRFGILEDRVDGTCHMDIDDIEEEEDDFRVVQKCSLKTCCNYKYCYVFVYIMLMLILVIAVIAFVVVIWLMLIPFVRTKDFRQSLCSVTRTYEYLAQNNCSCEKDCDSLIPCLVVFVQYLDDQGFSHNTSVHENEFSLDKQVKYFFFYVHCVLPLQTCDTFVYALSFSVLSTLHVEALTLT